MRSRRRRWRPCGCGGVEPVADVEYQNQHSGAALRRAMIERRRLIYLGADHAGVALATMADPPMTVRREYATRAVMHRLHQVHVRRIVLKAYRNQCSICRLRPVDLLDAAYTLADRHPKGEPIVTNGLGLCKIHHLAFDATILGIDRCRNRRGPAGSACRTSVPTGRTETRPGPPLRVVIWPRR